MHFYQNHNFRFHAYCVNNRFKLVAERVHEIWVLGTWNQPKKWVEGKSNKAFLHFVPKFCHIWWFFKVPQHLQRAPLWKIIKYGKKLAKNEEKPCSTCLQPIFRLILGTRKSDFGYPFRQYVVIVRSSGVVFFFC